MSISKIFIPNPLCVVSQIKDGKHIEQNFHSVARVMPRGGTCGCWGESKTLACGFAMAPHRLHTLGYNYTQTAFKIVSYSEATGGISVLSRTMVNLTLLSD